MATSAHPVLIDRDPFAGRSPRWRDRPCWPAHWIGPAESSGDSTANPLTIAGYRLRLEVPAAADGLLHVSADERFEFYLDGDLIGRGPERGILTHWPFHTFRVHLEPGEHVLAARVWSLGDLAPFAQVSAGHGFLLASEGFAGVAPAHTGTAPWEVALLPGYAPLPAGEAWGCGAKLAADGRAIPWDWERGAERVSTQRTALFAPPTVGDVAYAREGACDMPPGRMLVPARLPEPHTAQAPIGRIRHAAPHPPGTRTHPVPVSAADSDPAREGAWQGLLEGAPLTVPAQTCERVIVDLGLYTCGYPRVGLRGGRGAQVRVHWQEGLFAPDGSGKGNRDEVEGKLFGPVGMAEDGPGDLFVAGGGDEQHTTLWWEAGRYVEVLVTTADEPLELTGIDVATTHFGYEDTAGFRSSDPRLGPVSELALRTLQMCSHETTMDCPYYEQLQYGGDTRIQNLVAYASCDDDRLARQALRAFDHSRDADGLTRSRTPSRVRQTIPPFSLWWIAQVHDFALWRGDMDLVRELLPGVRAVLDAYRPYVDGAGLLHALPGWNFMDWVRAWDSGAPPGAHWTHSAPLQLQLAHVAHLAAELETWMGETELAARQERLSRRARDAAEVFFDEDTGLYADDLDAAAFSEHAQCLALLADAAHGREAVERMLAAGDGTDGPTLERTTVYFDHYLFEALYRVGRTDVLRERLGLWYALPGQGLTTVVEKPEPSRSDCHAWGAHPRFHMMASLLGIRPTSPGFATATVRPELGGLDWAEGTVRTPLGPLHVRASADGTLDVQAPAGVVVETVSDAA